MKDVTAEMRNYEEVLILLKDMGANPLLEEKLSRDVCLICHSSIHMLVCSGFALFQK